MSNSTSIPRTSSGARRQGVIWILTIPADKWDPCLPEGVTYIRGQREIGGKCEYEHWQLIAYFIRKVSLAGVKKVFPRESHAELTRSAAAEDYVFKEETYVQETRFEYGIKPVVRSSRTDWERVWEFARAGHFESIPGNVRVQNYSSLRRIRADYAQPEPMERTCYVFWGPTGVGKSRRAWDEAGWNAYPKMPSTKFWDGYTNQENGIIYLLVVIDEFRGEVGIGHLLRWFDRYPVLVEIKGSAVVLNARRIWITSNLSPSSWYPDVDKSTSDALMRRLQVTEFKVLKEIDDT